MNVRRLGRGDEAVVAALADRTPRADLLCEERTFFLVAFEDDRPVGFVLAYELLRRHKAAKQLLVYEIEVEPSHRGRGVGRTLMGELERIARERGIAEGWVLTDRDNAPAMAFYEAVGGMRPHEEIMWEFDYEAS